MPIRIRSHIRYDAKPPAPEPAPERTWESKKPNLDMYLSHGFATDKIMSLTGLSRVEINGRRARMRDRGILV